MISKRLLILSEDEPVTTRALALDLAEAGYRVETVTDPEEAIRRSRRVPFDLLIAAEQRGDSGRVFVERFRRVLPAAKVVLMTTSQEDRVFQVRDQGTRVGKPFDLDDIRVLVDRLLKEKETERATRSAK